jgi:hypothetical protein
LLFDVFKQCVFCWNEKSGSAGHYSRRIGRGERLVKGMVSSETNKMEGIVEICGEGFVVISSGP